MLSYGLNREQDNQRNSYSPVEDLATPEYLIDSKQHCVEKKKGVTLLPCQPFVCQHPALFSAWIFFSYIIFTDEKKTRFDLCNNQTCKQCSFFSSCQKNGKLMAIHTAVCAAAFCLLIFIRAPLLALFAWCDEGKYCSISIIRRAQYDLSSDTEAARSH